MICMILVSTLLDPLILMIKCMATSCQDLAKIAMLPLNIFAVIRKILRLNRNILEWREFGAGLKLHYSVLLDSLSQ